MAAVKVPADVELEDRLAFGLTAKQLAIFAATAVSAYGSFLVLAPVVPTPLTVAAMGLVAAGGMLVALVRHDGLAGDQLALALARFALAPKRQVLAPDGLPTPLPSAPRQPRVAPLDVPVQRILRGGLVQLADRSHCRLLTAHGTSFELRSEAEQAAFVAGFARFLNALSEPVQIDVRSEPVTLDLQAERIEAGVAAEAAALRRAAFDHARHLRSLGRTQPLSRRRILLVLHAREPRLELAEATLARRTAQAVELLAAAGVTLEPLDGDAAAYLLAATLAAPGPPFGSDLEGVIHAQPAPHPQTDTHHEDERSRARAARSGGPRAAQRPRSRRRSLAADVRDQRLPA